MKREYWKALGVLLYYVAVLACAVAFQLVCSARARGAELNVRDFGAKGDGRANDTPAIQRAIDAAKPSGRVFFPAGIYGMRVSSGRCLTVYPGVVLAGASRDTARIRLADKQGDYKFLIGPNPETANATNFGLQDLTIDQNTTNNPGVASPRFVFMAYAGSGIQIRNCRFADAGGVSVVLLSGTGMADCSIESCWFDGVKGRTIDHSSIFALGDRFRILNNTFTGSGLGAVTAIETHGNQHVVQGNIISDFRQGMNITGAAYRFGSAGQVVSGNTITRAKVGIQLWANDGPDPALTETVVSSNAIALDAKKWAAVPGPTCGIRLEPTRNAETRNISITNNAIRLDNGGESTYAADWISGGVVWQSGNGAVDANLAIVGNTIDGSLGSSIYVGANATGLRVAGNVLCNPGMSRANFAQDYRSGILLTGQQNGIVSQNQILDYQPVHTIGYGIRNAATGFGAFSDNTLTVQDGASVPAYK